jgi:predicted polyphosphate/ATP-dependent NAD kinase
VSASIISRGDGPPILDPAEHVLNAVSLLIECLVVVGRMLSPLARWDAGGNTFVFQFITEPVCIVTAIGKQFTGFGQTVKQVPGTFVIVGLTFR